MANTADLAATLFGLKSRCNLFADGQKQQLTITRPVSGANDSEMPSICRGASEITTSGGVRYSEANGCINTHTPNEANCKWDKLSKFHCYIYFLNAKSLRKWFQKLNSIINYSIICPLWCILEIDLVKCLIIYNLHNLYLNTNRSNP